MMRTVFSVACDIGSILASAAKQAGSPLRPSQR